MFGTYGMPVTRIVTPLPLLLCLVPGAVVLAFADVPQSLDMVFLTGIDLPEYGGSQLLIALSGALATASAILLARWWPPLVAAGSLGVLLAYVLHRPVRGGLSMRMVNGAESSTADFELHLLWACLLVASSGVLLIGLLGAVQVLMRRRFAGAAATAVVASAAYYGVSIAGPLRGGETVALTLVVLCAATALTVLGAVRLRDVTARGRPSRNTRIVCALAVVATVLSTALVAITGGTVLGTWLGAFAGIVVTGTAAVAAGRFGGSTLAATAALSFVLVAPVSTLFIFADALSSGTPWYGWPLALAGVGAGAVAAATRHRVWLATALTAVAAIPLLVIAGNRDLWNSDLMSWLTLVTLLAAVAAAAGGLAPTFASTNALPAAGGLVMAMSVGMHGILGFLRAGGDSRTDINTVFGPVGMLMSATLLIAGALMLIMLTGLRPRWHAPEHQPSPTRRAAVG